MARHLCLHGHFYQPPRENPWLETVELQDSARPYHDWNERVTSECYAPNAASRILDASGRIDRIVNNYERISFNFGPTLLAWLADARPEVYCAILDADRRSRERYSGHGSALAQAYNHAILPLANRRDKQTQVRWGLRDFARRFGRAAEGCWLPETAADTETLEVLAAEGVRFTILEPHQALRVRPLPPGQEDSAAARAWRDVGGGRIDCTVPYRVALPSGRSLAVFFYDGPVARAVAFEELLASGDRFIGRLLGAFPPGGGGDRLVSIATDGETYGHHHRYGEMALSYALHQIEARGLAKLTNFGEFLAAHPPRQEVEIVEKSSWSCAHGIDRWREDCGCATGGEPGWNQAWRAPLRDALDALRDEVAPRFEAAAGELVGDPWAARDDYVEVVLDRSSAGVEAFLARHARGGRALAPAERVRLLGLLEMQRHAMLMYTSCGWFFADLGGIETVQVLRYAGRVVQLAEELFGGDHESELLRRLGWARSNDPAVGSGRDLYEAQVRPARVGLQQVAAHYAISSQFRSYPSPARIYGYEVEREAGSTESAGSARLDLGRLRVTSVLTGEAERVAYGVLSFGDPHLSAGVRRMEEAESGAFESLCAAARTELAHGSVQQVVRLLDSHFGSPHYSLESLFRDEQRRILDALLASTQEEVETDLRRAYTRHAPLLRYLQRLGTPAPGALHATAQFVVDADLARALADPEADPDQAGRQLAEAQALGVELDQEGLGYALEQTLGTVLERVVAAPRDRRLLGRAEAWVALARAAPFEVNLARAQNVCHELRETVYRPLREAAERSGGLAAEASAAVEPESGASAAVDAGGAGTASRPPVETGHAGNAGNAANAHSDAHAHNDAHAGNTSNAANGGDESDIAQWLALFRLLAEGLSLRVD
jgi:alpha-amylase/alpha-mannosidase (GH57 family)